MATESVPSATDRVFFVTLQHVTSDSVGSADPTTGTGLRYFWKKRSSFAGSSATTHQ